MTTTGRAFLLPSTHITGCSSLSLASRENLAPVPSFYEMKQNTSTHQKTSLCKNEGAANLSDLALSTGEGTNLTHLLHYSCKLIDPFSSIRGEKVHDSKSGCAISKIFVREAVDEGGAMCYADGMCTGKDHNVSHAQPFGGEGRLELCQLNPPSLSTLSRAANATISAHDTTPGQAASSWVFAWLIGLTCSDGLLAVEAISTDPSHPCTTRRSELAIAGAIILNPGDI
ncbi:hypothetical protein AKJ16_DCAP26509 [Drosera capensis]